MTVFSDSFVLLRDCRGNCIDPMKKFDEWKAALGAFVCTVQWCAIEMQHLLQKAYVNEVTLNGQKLYLESY